MPAANVARETHGGTPYRVLLCDDSAAVRGAMMRILTAESDIDVVGSVPNGQMAIEQVRRHDVDVVLLDIEMPVMDGMTALPQILRARPGVRVIMASTLTRRNAAISIKALTLGATDYVAKPDASGIHGSAEFGRELVGKVRAIAQAARQRRSRAVAVPAMPGPAAPAAPVTIALRPRPLLNPRLLAIGSSTGGPQALDVLLGVIGPQVTVPIVIVQHMPPTFTALLAESLAKSSGIPCAEGRDNEPILPGRAYIAPGDFHMTVEGEPGNARLRVYQAPPENFCRPAVDPLLFGVSTSYGSRALAVFLTGMGSDGCKGAAALVKAGGSVFAQDEATSVVWGMPGAVAKAGLCSAVLPLTPLSNDIKSMVTARAR
ncbi:MAG: protein-glutamate methylesterase/protein-glutamine glutaminase [Alphaproteobacteria bacterium]